MELLNHLELSISPNQVRPTLRALLHGIFFHRILDLVEPDTYEINDAHVAVYPTSTVEREVNTKIEEFVRETVDMGKERGEIAVVFLQRRPRKGWFAVTEELIPWEEHLITLHFPRTSSRNYKPPSTNALPLALLQLLNFCAEKKNNVPPLTGTSEAKNAGLGDSYQILISPPPPEEIFSPSPPTHPTRLTSPPPGPSLTTTPATALARDMTLPASSAADEAREVGRASNPAGISYGYGAQGHGGPAAQGVSGQGVSVGGYFEQAKDGLRAVGARAGAVAGWTGRTGQSRGN